MSTHFRIFLHLKNLTRKIRSLNLKWLCISSIKRNSSQEISLILTLNRKKQTNAKQNHKQKQNQISISVSYTLTYTHILSNSRKNMWLSMSYNFALYLALLSLHLSSTYYVPIFSWVFYIDCFTESSKNSILHVNCIILLYLTGGEFKMQRKPSAQLNLKFEWT